MNLPDSLPARMYLLAYDTEKNRLTSRTQLGLVVRAAALAELSLRQRLADDGGRARVVGADPTGDEILDEILQDMSAGKPRAWHRWVGRQEHRASRAVRSQLEAAGWLKVEHRALLPDKVELREAYKVKKYVTDLRTALQRPAGQVDPKDAAVLAIAWRGELGTVLSRAERRAYNLRLVELGDRTAPVADALKKALQSKRAAMASS